MSLTKQRIGIATLVLGSLFGTAIFATNSVNASNSGITFNRHDASWRRMELWKTNALSGTTCNAACGKGFCLGAYVDDQRSDKVSSSATTPNKNCICVGRR